MKGIREVTLSFIFGYFLEILRVDSTGVSILESRVVIFTCMLTDGVVRCGRVNSSSSSNSVSLTLQLIVILQFMSSGDFLRI